jgi:phytoene synthase
MSLGGRLCIGTRKHRGSARRVRSRTRDLLANGSARSTQPRARRVATLGRPRGSTRHWSSPAFVDTRPPTRPSRSCPPGNSGCAPFCSLPALQPRHRRSPSYRRAGLIQERLSRSSDTPDSHGMTPASDASTFNPCVFLLPDNLKTNARRPYHALRTIDDLVDEGDPEAEQRVEAVERWARGQATPSPEAQIFAELSTRYALTPEPLLEFCSGMRHDLNGDVIEDEQDLERYCQNVGGAVGALFARMVGTSHPDGEDKLALLGRAFQRTHILRDIDEDHGQGRLYIARSTIERFGCPAPGAREDLLRDQIARAELLYEAGIDAIPLFPSAR